MSVEAIAWALRRRVPPVAKLVLISIANCADRDGENAFPGQNHIAEDVGVTDRSVRTWIKWLESEGYLSRKRRERTNGSRTSDGYTLHLCDNRKDFPVVHERHNRKLGVEPTGSYFPHHNRQSNRQPRGIQKR